MHVSLLPPLIRRPLPFLILALGAIAATARFSAASAAPPDRANVPRTMPDVASRLDELRERTMRAAQEAKERRYDPDETWRRIAASPLETHRHLERR